MLRVRAACTELPDTSQPPPQSLDTHAPLSTPGHCQEPAEELEQWGYGKTHAVPQWQFGTSVTRCSLLQCQAMQEASKIKNTCFDLFFFRGFLCKRQKRERVRVASCMKASAFTLKSLYILTTPFSALSCSAPCHATKQSACESRRVRASPRQRLAPV